MSGADFCPPGHKRPLNCLATLNFSGRVITLGQSSCRLARLPPSCALEAAGEKGGDHSPMSVGLGSLGLMSLG